MKLRDAILAESLPLPPIPAGLMYQYIVAGNGLFIRAEDRRMEAMVPVALADVHGLELVESYVRLKVPRVPANWLWSIQESARKRLPNEAMYQLLYDDGWRCVMPPTQASAAALAYEDRPEAVIDLHSHGTLRAFFSETDDRDEQGFRLYIVVGRVGHSIVDLADPPQIAARVGIFGHFESVSIDDIFAGDGPFVQVDPDVEMVIEEDENETPSKFVI
jgi:PRTRC genetic system protein A